MNEQHDWKKKEHILPKEFRTFDAMAEHSTRWPGAQPKPNTNGHRCIRPRCQRRHRCCRRRSRSNQAMRQASAVCEEEIFDKIVKMEPSIGPIAGSLGNHCPFCQRNSRLLCVHTVALVRSVLANEPVWRAPRDPRRRHVSWLYNQLKASKILKWLQEKPEAVAAAGEA